MTVSERRTYWKIAQRRFGEASRDEQGQLLDEIAKITDLDRRSLVGEKMGDLACQQPQHHIAGWLDQFLALPGAEKGEAENVFDILLPAGRGKPQPGLATLQAWPTEVIHRAYSPAKSRAERAQAGSLTKSLGYTIIRTSDSAPVTSTNDLTLSLGRTAAVT